MWGKINRAQGLALALANRTPVLHNSTMILHTIESLAVAVADADQAAAQYARLGLVVVQTPLADLNLWSWSVGATSVRLLPGTPATHHPLTGPAHDALAAQRALFALVVQVPDVPAALIALTARGVTAIPNEDGTNAWLPIHAQAGANVLLVQAPLVAVGPTQHSFPLRRLDHLATVTPDLNAKTQFWTEMLGVPLVGEVTTPTMIIRQLRIGDAIVELLGPASADSPLHQRVPGLVSMASWEVPDLEAAVQQAQAAGFTPTVPAVGVLPGTRTATIPGAELAGVNLQMLSYG